MRWYDRIIRTHTKVTDAVSHFERMKSDRYFVWQEDGAKDFNANNLHSEKAVVGTTDLFTKREFDPWKDEFEAALNMDDNISWYLNSVQREEDTGFVHYEWVWQVMDGV